MEEAEVVGVEVEAFLVMTLVAVGEVAFLVVGEAMAEVAGALVYQIALMACLAAIPAATEAEVAWTEWHHSLHHQHQYPSRKPR